MKTNLQTINIGVNKYIHKYKLVTYKMILELHFITEDFDMTMYVRLHVSWNDNEGIAIYK